MMNLTRQPTTLLYEALPGVAVLVALAVPVLAFAWLMSLGIG